MLTRVLVVDDHAERGPAVVSVLSFRFECRLATSFDGAVRALSETPEPWDVVVSDFDLDGPGTGIQVLELARTLSERTIRIFYTSYFVDAIAQEALRRALAHAVLDARAVDFLSKLRECVERLAEADAGLGEVAHLPVPPVTLRDDGNPLVADWCAHAESTQTFLPRLREAAGHRGPVYAVGEEGSGKHLARRTLRAWCAAVRSDAGGLEREPPALFVDVPPLRERRPDIVPLVTRMLDRLSVTRPPAKHLAAEVGPALAESAWPENVRGLHAAVLSAWRNAGERREILPRDFEALGDASWNPLRVRRAEGELAEMQRLLRLGRTVNAAARVAGQTPQNFRRAMDRLGVLRIDSGAAADD